MDSKKSKKSSAKKKLPIEPKPIWEIAVELGRQIPKEEWANLPKNGSIHYKHYLYGWSSEDDLPSSR